MNFSKNLGQPSQRGGMRKKRTTVYRGQAAGIRKKIEMFTCLKKCKLPREVTDQRSTSTRHTPFRSKEAPSEFVPKVAEMTLLFKNDFEIMRP